MTVRFIVADVFDGLAQLEDGSVDLVVTSPPFLALRSYLPANHPDKGREIGSEATPAEFIDTLLRLTGELRRVLAPHGSICVELGDTYSGSGGGGGDYLDGGMREGQQQFSGAAASMRESNAAHWRQKNQNVGAWPEAKSKTLIPEAYRLALAYGVNPLTGRESPAGRWLVRNVVTWVRPNPPVGALGDKWRPATSDMVIACTSPKRYWDDVATRRPHSRENFGNLTADKSKRITGSRTDDGKQYYTDSHPAGAPLLDWWEIPPGGYDGAHYAVMPPALVVPCVQAMLPPRVCETCGEPQRRIVDRISAGLNTRTSRAMADDPRQTGAVVSTLVPSVSQQTTVGWSDCGHNQWRPAHILDPFAGSGTTGLVATGHDADTTVTLIDLDERNETLARDRIGPLLFTL